VSRLRSSLSRLSPTLAISVVAVVLAMSGWTLAATNGAGGSGSINGCVVKKGPGKGTLRVVARAICPKGSRLIVFNREGPVGPPGPAGAPAALPPLEAVHFVGAAGEPAFEGDSKNTEASTPAGFFKDQLGIVHLRGTVDVGVGENAFRLPPAFQPPNQVCFSVPGFKAGATVFVTNRLCVFGGSGEVRNSRGEAVTYISIDGIEFRTG
jgi:hypothetical protein